MTWNWIWIKSERLMKGCASDSRLHEPEPLKLKMLNLLRGLNAAAASAADEDSSHFVETGIMSHSIDVCCSQGCAKFDSLAVNNGSLEVDQTSARMT